MGGQAKGNKFLALEETYLDQRQVSTLGGKGARNWTKHIFLV